MIYLELFYEFFKTGLFAIGGGLATLPFLTEIGQRTGWFTNMELANMVAVSESTPGSIGMNMASYVGYTSAGIPGVIIATMGLAAPSIIIIIIIARVLKKFCENNYVNLAFEGVRPASTGLIAAATVAIFEMGLINIDAFKASGNVLDMFSIKSIALFAVLWVFSNLVKPTKNLHPIVFIAVSAALGIALGLK